MQELWTSPSGMAVIVVRTLAVYLFILVAFRLSGKREVGQLAPFDFALILLIANAVQNAMVGPDTSLAGGLVAAAVLLTVNFAKTGSVNFTFRSSACCGARPGSS